MICPEDREEWRPVPAPAYSRFYEVSSFGRVRRAAPGRRTHVGRLVVPQPIRTGHLRVLLHAGGVPAKFAVHRLVLEAFVGPAPAGTVGCHNNDVADDNRLANLRWDTPKANTADSWRLGGQRRRFGTERGRVAKLTESAVVQIRQMVAAGQQQLDCARMFGVSSGTISMIASRKIWRHV